MFDGLAAVLAHPFHHQLARPGYKEIGGAILVAKGVPANDDRVGPTRHEARHRLDDDGFTEDHATQNVADGAVRRLPHALQAEFLHPRFVGGDRRTLHADAMFANGIGRLHGDLVIGFVAAFHAEIEINQLDVEIRQDQLFADPLPDDPGHLVAVELHDRIFDLDLRHDCPLIQICLRYGHPSRAASARGSRIAGQHMLVRQACRRRADAPPAPRDRAGAAPAGRDPAAQNRHRRCGAAR